MNKSWKTKLIHSDTQIPNGFQSLNVAVHHASTTIFANADAVSDYWDQYEAGYTYGLYGTPTTLELAARICELEGGYSTLITPGWTERDFFNQLRMLEFGRSRVASQKYLWSEPEVCNTSPAPLRS